MLSGALLGSLEALFGSLEPLAQLVALWGSLGLPVGSLWGFCKLFGALWRPHGSSLALAPSENSLGLSRALWTLKEDTKRARIFIRTNGELIFPAQLYPTGSCDIAFRRPRMGGPNVVLASKPLENMRFLKEA